MKQIAKSLMMLAAVAVLCVGGCDKKEADGGDKKADKKDEDKPSLMLSTDTPGCRAALKCCEEMVEAENGKKTPENINLMCSGVGMADSDETCGEFKKGYAMTFEASGKPVPDSCK